MQGYAARFELSFQMLACEPLAIDIGPCRRVGSLRQALTDLHVVDRSWTSVVSQNKVLLKEGPGVVLLVRHGSQT